MTGPEHYSEAERLANQWKGEEPTYAALTLQAAQVRATLALAAAVAKPGELYTVRLEGERAPASRYGSVFDHLADRWSALEREHDQVHPDRNECGGVGGCSMMAHAHDLETRMVEQLEDWRHADAEDGAL